MTEKGFPELALQEPKKVFVNMIVIPYMRQIGYELTSASSTSSIRTMRTLLNMLEDQDREILGDIVKQLEDYEVKLPHNRLELEYLFRRISAHLHIYYLREFGIRAINPNPKPIRTEQPENPQPQHIGAEQ